MFRHYLIIFTLLSMVFISCSENKETEEELTTPVVEQPVVETPTYPRLPAEYVSALLQQADALEGTFYNSGKSISLWDSNVKSVLSMMTEPAPKVLDNNIVGHIMYLKEGEQLAYVEVSLKDNNNYVIYKVNGNKFYNTLTPQGVEFLKGMATASAPPAQ